MEWQSYACDGPGMFDMVAPAIIVDDPGAVLQRWSLTVQKGDVLVQDMGGISVVARQDFDSRYWMSGAMVCRNCGCSQYDACPKSCEWVEEGLCSACLGDGEDVRRIHTTGQSNG